MIILARYESWCGRCRRRIRVGDEIEWTKGEPATHTTCDEAPPLGSGRRYTGNEEPPEVGEVVVVPHNGCRGVIVAVRNRFAEVEYEEPQRDRDGNYSRFCVDKWTRLETP